MTKNKLDFSKYIIKGKRKLSSGIESYFFYDFKLLKEKRNEKDLSKILKLLKKEISRIKCKCLDYPRILGIYNMGAYIVKKLTDKPIIFYPKLDKLTNVLVRCIGFEEEYVIFIDVGTTFNIIKRAIDKIGFPPLKIFVIINRIEINNGIWKLEYNQFNKEIEIIELKKLI